MVVLLTTVEPLGLHDLGAQISRVLYRGLVFTRGNNKPCMSWIVKGSWRWLKLSMVRDLPSVQLFANRCTRGKESIPSLGLAARFTEMGAIVLGTNFVGARFGRLA